MIYVLLTIPLVLTFTMFHTRQMILGFPCAMFWALLGGQAYIMSTTTWDMYYLLFFATTFGMTVFSILAMYGLRERKDTGEEEEGFIDEEEDTSRYIDEEKGEEIELGDNEPKMSKRTKGIRARAKQRRSGENKRLKL